MVGAASKDAANLHELETEMGLDQKAFESDMDIDDRCLVCNDGISYEGNAIVYCDKCDAGCHQACYGIHQVPEGEWYCKPCSDGLDARTISCELCCRTGGIQVRTRDSVLPSNRYVHAVCALWIPGVEFSDPDNFDGAKGFTSIDPERMMLECMICKKVVGACVQCDYRSCYKAYHPSCALDSLYDMQMKESSAGIKLMSHCPKHDTRPKKQQQIAKKRKKMVEQSTAQHVVNSIRQKTSTTVKVVAPKLDRVVARTTPKSAREVASSAPQPAKEVASSAPQPAKEVASSAPQPAKEVASSSAPKSAKEVASSAPKSAREETSSAPKSERNVKDQKPVHGKITSFFSTQATNKQHSIAQGAPPSSVNGHSKSSVTMAPSSYDQHNSIINLADDISTMSKVRDISHQVASTLTESLPKTPTNVMQSVNVKPLSQARSTAKVSSNFASSHDAAKKEQKSTCEVPSSLTTGAVPTKEGNTVRWNGGTIDGGCCTGPTVGCDTNQPTVVKISGAVANHQVSPTGLSNQPVQQLENSLLAITPSKPLGQSAVQTVARTTVATEDDDATVCVICSSGDCGLDDEIVMCERCGVSCHQSCYGVPQVPEGPWFCKPCAMGVHAPSTVCVLCGHKGGALCPSSQHSPTRGTWAHTVCVLWVPGVAMDDPILHEGFKEVEKVDPKRRKLMCNVCRKRGHVCIQCTTSSCAVAFHPSCAMRTAGIKMELQQSPTDPSGVDFVLRCMKHAKPRGAAKPVVSGTKKRGRGRPKGSKSKKKKLVEAPVTPVTHSLARTGSSSTVKLLSTLDVSTPRNKPLRHAPSSTQVCGVCQFPPTSTETSLVKCADCGCVAHRKCLGTNIAGSYKTQCQPCALQLPAFEVSCKLCPRGDRSKSPLLMAEDGNYWGHAVCVLWSPRAHVRADTDGIKWTIRDGLPVEVRKCIVCGIAQGDCIKCDSCEVWYHPYCGLAKGFMVQSRNPCSIERGAMSLCCPMHDIPPSVVSDPGYFGGVKKTKPKLHSNQLYQCAPKTQFWHFFMRNYQQFQDSGLDLRELSLAIRQAWLVKQCTQGGPNAQGVSTNGQKGTSFDSVQPHSLLPQTASGSSMKPDGQELTITAATVNELVSDSLIASVIGDTGNDSERYSSRSFFQCLDNKGQCTGAPSCSKFDSLQRAIQARLKHQTGKEEGKYYKDDIKQALDDACSPTDNCRSKQWEQVLGEIRHTVLVKHRTPISIEAIEIGLGVGSEELLDVAIKRAEEKLKKIENTIERVSVGVSKEFREFKGRMQICTTEFASAVQDFRQCAAKELEHRARVEASNSQLLSGSCSVCNKSESNPGNLIIYCDGCSFAVHHKSCYGMLRVQPGEWYCRRCQQDGTAYQVSTESTAALASRPSTEKNMSMEVDSGESRNNLSMEVDSGASRSNLSMEVDKGVSRNNLSMEAGNGASRNNLSMEAGNGASRNNLSMETDKGVSQNKTHMEPVEDGITGGDCEDIALKITNPKSPASNDNTLTNIAKTALACTKENTVVKASTSIL